MLGIRYQVSGGLGISLGCRSIWCSQLSGKDNEKGKIEIGYQIPDRMLGHARRAAPWEARAAALPGMLDEAPAGALLGLPAPLGWGVGALFSPAQGHASFFSSGC